MVFQCFGDGERDIFDGKYFFSSRKTSIKSELRVFFSINFSVLFVELALTLRLIERAKWIPSIFRKLNGISMLFVICCCCWCLMALAGVAGCWMAQKERKREKNSVWTFIDGGDDVVVDRIEREKNFFSWLNFSGAQFDWRGGREVVDPGGRIEHKWDDKNQFVTRNIETRINIAMVSDFVIEAQILAENCFCSAIK